MNLTKRQKQALSDYSGSEWLMVFGVDYKVVMNLVRKGLLDFDHKTGKVRSGTPPKTFNYSVGFSHPNLPVFHEPLEVSHPDEVPKAVDAMLRNFCKKHAVYLKDVYVDVDPVKPKAR